MRNADIGDTVADGIGQGELPRIFGGWTTVALTLAKMVASTHGVPAVALELIQSLVDAQSSTAGLLSSIKGDTQSIRGGNLATGLRRFQEACFLEPSDPMWHRHIEKAEEKLFDALDQVRNDQELLLVEFNLAMVYAAIERPDQARRHLRSSTQAATRALDAYLETPWWDFLRSKSSLEPNGYPLIQDFRTDAIHKQAGADSLMDRARTASLKAAGQAAYLVAGLSLGTLAIPGGRYLSRQQRGLISDLEQFLTLYNTNELAVSILEETAPRYVALNNNSASAYRMFWINYL